MFLSKCSVRYSIGKRLNCYSNSVKKSLVLIHNVYVHHVFDEMPQREIYFLNSLLASYLRSGDAIATWGFFLHMHCIRCDLNSHSFTPVLGACSALSSPLRGQQVHALMMKTGSETEVTTKTALIDMYSKSGQLDSSVSVFDEMEFKDVVAWNAMFSALLRHGFPVKALQLFEEMNRERVEFSEFTLCSVLKACTSLKAYRQGMQVHGLVIVMDRDMVVLSTALIDFYSSTGYIDEALKIYRTLTWIKDDVIRCSLIAGCVRNGKHNVAMCIMSSMRPNVVALTSALSACSKNSDLWAGKQIHSVAIRQGFILDSKLCNVLVDMYSKCGKISNARLVFEGISKKDVVSWTSMIDAYGIHGHGVEAFELFSNMGSDKSGVLPNSVTLLAVLSACAHSGMVEEGRQCLFNFQEKFALVPGPEHYACFMDILGRAGQIKEAWFVYADMIKNGTEPTSAVWSALLNACRINQDVKGGEFAAKNLLELEADNPGNYVALSNFYAAIGQWDAVDNMRNMMSKRRISKEMGSSWLAVSGGNERLKASPVD